MGSYFFAIMESTQVQSRIDFQRLLASKINNIYERFKQVRQEDRTKGFLVAKLREIQSNCRSFEEEHREIFTIIPPTERITNEYLSSSIYNDVCSIQSRMEVRIENMLDELNIAHQASTSSSFLPPQINFPNSINITQPKADHLRLPAMDIEPFSGEFHKWTSFKSLFGKIVHSRTDIEPLEKLYHLLMKVTGEPKRMISHFSLTSDNYESAWNTLLNRYDNERALVNTELKILINQPSIPYESAKQLKNLVDVTHECLNSLKNLGIDITSWDPILIYILTQKIDPETQKHWENSLQQPKELPSFKKFINFLETRFQCLENLSTSPSDKQYLQHSQSHQNRSNYTAKNLIPQNRNNYTANNQIPQNRNNYTANNKIHQNRYDYTASNQKSSFNNTQPTKNNSAAHFSNPFRSTNQYRTQPANSPQSFVVEYDQNCPYCNNQHKLFSCQEFSSMSMKQKNDTVEKLKLCFNCLGNHQSDTCGSSKRCKHCNHRHHTLLHSSQPSTSTTSHYVENYTPKTQVLLATAIIPVNSSSGQQIFLRCLLDQGSQSSFITEAATQQLGLRKTPIIATVTGLGSVPTETSKSLVTFNLNSRYDIDLQLSVEALVLSKITGNLPSSFIATEVNWDHIKDLFLADPQFSHPSKIDVLLGADIYSQILLDGLKRGPLGAPIAQHTKLGWILSGQVWTNNNQNSRNISSFHHRFDIDTQIKKFWEIEELPKKRIFTNEETKCEEFFEKTHKRDESGRFIVGLPFKEDRSPLGKSKFRALQRFNQLQLKFQKNHQYCSEYKAVMAEYIESNHMIKCSHSNEIEESYFLPHHAVIKESSSTTKTRVVFDASAKTSSGESLNDQLLVGPTIQQDLASILIRWKTHKIILSADITKMYRQIWLRKEDQRFHKLLWIDANENQIQEFQLKTVTFGTASAAYLAIKSLQQLAKDEASKYPIASQIALRDFYVDDLLTGTDTPEEAIILQDQISNLLGAGGFQLRKWVTNDENVLQQIPHQLREIAFPLSFDLNDSTKTLGIHYHPAIDIFKFKVQTLSSSEIPTKRTLLSDTARLFDPLGWLAPVIIKAKIMLQQVWQAGYDWDHRLKDPIKEEWLRYKSELKQLESIRIPRWIGKQKFNKKIQLHGFCDASQDAYSAVVYIKITDHQGNNTISLMSSKTKVAPIKTISLPRLELCGAYLLAGLMTFVQNALMMNIEECFCWTDSEIVLAWLRGKPAKWKTFVANRVVSVLGHTNCSQWRHISSHENPADCASRGIYPSELENNKLWWSGPEWLGKFDSATSQQNLNFDTNLEAKSTNVIVHHVQSTNEFSWMHNYSSLNKLLRITSLILRFSYNCRNAANRKTGPITTHEYNIAMTACIKNIQHSEFHREIHQIKTTGQCDNKSRLLPLTPFIDKNEILRVGGRLKFSNLTFNQKHQMILPYNHHFTKLIIRDAHLRTEHGGAQITTSILRNNFWVLKCRNSVKNIVHNCIICYRYKKLVNNQLMGSLPDPRCQINPPFSKVGIDYCGPYNIKTSRLRGSKIYKCYIAIFICLATKAVHVEVVSELSTQAFLASFKRFVGRRGLPTDVYSDNGTNFVGADKILQKLIRANTNFNEILYDTTKRGIKWHFIPPRSPHFGGIWEAAVKSLKKHLIRIIGNLVLTFEELSTVVIQIEASLNSRPITPLSDDPTDLNALTPGHFLIGRELLATPVEDLTDRNINHLNRWNLLSKIHQDVWKRWKNEYLHNLQDRKKWKQAKKESKIGDMVLLKEDNLPPNKWSLARVIHVHPGDDGHIRVVTVKTSSGTFKRPITKIFPLPIEENTIDGDNNNAPPEQDN